MAKFLGEEFDRVDFEEITDDRLAGLLEDTDRDLVLTFAERIVLNPKEHEYDKYDETRINELPLPTNCTLNEAQSYVDDFRHAVVKEVDRYKEETTDENVVLRAVKRLNAQWATAKYIEWSITGFGKSKSDITLNRVFSALHNLEIDGEVESAEVKDSNGKGHKIYREAV